MDDKQAEDKIKLMLDTSESMGYDRGVMTILLELLKMMEQYKAKYVTYEQIKQLYDRFKKK